MWIALSSQGLLQRARLLRGANQRTLSTSALGRALARRTGGVHAPAVVSGASQPLSAVSRLDVRSFASDAEAPEASEAYGASEASLPILRAAYRPEEFNSSRRSRWLRKYDLLPGVLYGKNFQQPKKKRFSERLLVTVHQRHIAQELESRGAAFESTVYRLRLCGSSGEEEEHLVVPRCLGLDPVYDTPVSVNFLRYYPTERRAVRVPIPVKIVNREKSEALRRGAALNEIHREVLCKCTCKPWEVPHYLELDVAGAEVLDKRKCSDLVFPEGVTPLMDADTTVANVKKLKGKLAVEAQAAAAEAAAEEGAA